MYSSQAKKFQCAVPGPDASAVIRMSGIGSTPIWTRGQPNASAVRVLSDHDNDPTASFDQGKALCSGLNCLEFRGYLIRGAATSDSSSCESRMARLLDRVSTVEFGLRKRFVAATPSGGGDM